MAKEVTLNSKEQKRLLVLNRLLEGRMTAREAAEMVGVSTRQMQRLLAGYRKRGAAALMHGNRGRLPVNRVEASVEAEIVQLAREAYVDYNDCHFTEELAERHQIAVSRPTVRRIRRENGLGSPRKRRAPAHRSRRQRYPQGGMLLQVDGSRHDWLEGRGPWLTLHAAIDDATNEVPWALFREQEDATGYALLLHHISQSHGLPLALYSDRHSIFQSPKEATLEEQLQGLEPRSHLGRLLDDLQVRLIPAHSPQAKGRVERLFGTLQDRLVKELRRAQAGTIAEANAVLQAYLPRFNQRFMQPPAQAGSAYRPRLSLAEANTQLHFTYWRTVANDHTFSLFGQRLMLPALPARLNLAGRQVALHHRMDGRLAVVFQGQLLGLLQPAQLGPPRLELFQSAPQHLAEPRTSAARPASPAASTKPAPATPKTYKPAADHPWRRGAPPLEKCHKQSKEQQQNEPG